MSKPAATELRARGRQPATAEASNDPAAGDRPCQYVLSGMSHICPKNGSRSVPSQGKSRSTCHSRASSRASPDRIHRSPKWRTSGFVSRRAAERLRDRRHQLAKRVAQSEQARCHRLSGRRSSLILHAKLRRRRSLTSDVANEVDSAHESHREVAMLRLYK